MDMRSLSKAAAFLAERVWDFDQLLPLELMVSEE
jgi:hypothetical protein